MLNPPRESFFVGVDVGTGSARAGVFDKSGIMRGSASAPIQLWKPAPDYVEQSSNDIWLRCCEVVRTAVAKAGIAADAVSGLGFDATCSLVVLDGDGRPISVSTTSNAEQNVIVWMDHRAVDQAIGLTKPGMRFCGTSEE